MLDPWTFGFERHLDLLKDLEDVRIKSSYPPYNIKTLPDNKAEIELAIAGFTKDDVTITYKENIITVEGNRGEDDAEYSYKGIAGRNFVQKFAVADDVIVSSASLNDGFLTIALERLIPEEKKEKKISIK
jgi:molecular chaperone IbpA